VRFLKRETDTLWVKMSGFRVWGTGWSSRKLPREDVSYLPWMFYTMISSLQGISNTLIEVLHFIESVCLTHHINKVWLCSSMRVSYCPSSQTALHDYMISSWVLFLNIVMQVMRRWESYKQKNIVKETWGNNSH
jgi:hypothetical protein